MSTGGQIRINLPDLMVSAFNGHFYKVFWPIVGANITFAIKDVFSKGKLLIPKSDSPAVPADFRPISLTNELYKIIARIIADRMKVFMDKIIANRMKVFTCTKALPKCDKNLI